MPDKRYKPPLTIPCVVCGAEIGVWPVNLKRGKRFCSRECARIGRPSLADRFWPKVNKNGPVPSHVPHLGPCWLWTAGRRNGYGQIGHSPGDGSHTMLPAHRVAWELTRGPIPDGMQVCHACDTPLCVNPGHLFLGTLRDNMRDMVAKGRSLAGDKNPARRFPERIARGPRNGMVTHPERVPRGERNAHATHTEEDVRRLRLAVANGARLKDAALACGFNPKHAGRVVRGERWAHVQ